MPTKRKGGYYRDGKYIAFTWGDKISEAQKRPEHRLARNRPFICKACGKKQDGWVKNQNYCNKKCKYDALGDDPIAKKAFTLFNTVSLGKGKKEYALKAVKKSLGKPCRYCKILLTLENMSLDHITPFSETKWRTNKLVKKQLDVVANIQIVCRSCNQLKGNLPHDKFMKLLEFMDTDLEVKAYLLRKLAQSNIMWSFKRNARNR